VFSEPDGGTTVMVSAPVVGGPEQPVLAQQQQVGSGSAII
jgi:hypothetical protein